MSATETTTTTTATTNSTAAWVDRVQSELLALRGNIERLAAFIRTPKFEALADADRADLREQYDAMVAYEAPLARRFLRGQAQLIHG